MKELTCLKENKQYPTSNFFPAKKDSIYGEFGYIPFCKTCISDMAKSYFTAFSDRELAIFLTCMKLDVGFDKELYEKVVTDKLGVERAIRAYLTEYSKTSKVLYTNGDKMSFALGIFEMIKDYLSVNDLEEKSLDFDWVKYKVTENDIAFWGSDYSQEEYYFLTYTFEEYFESYSVDSPASRELLKQICLTTLEIRKLRDIQKKTESEAEKLTYNKAIDDLTNRLLKILSDNNMKPNQKKNLNDNQESFGTLIKKWEDEDPVPDPFTEWQKNNIFKDVAIWITGHIREMLGYESQPDYIEERDKYTVDGDD